MVYLEPSQLGHLALVKTFCNNLENVFLKIKSNIEKKFTLLVDVLVAYIKKYASLPVHKSIMALVNSSIKMIKYLMKDYTAEGATLPKDIEYIFDNQILFSIIWGIASAVEEPSRKGLSDFLLKLIRASADILL